jgi:hypothetical protein
MQEFIVSFKDGSRSTSFTIQASVSEAQQIQCEVKRAFPEARQITVAVKGVVGHF